MSQPKKRYRLWTIPVSGEPQYFNAFAPLTAYRRAKDLDAKEFGLEVQTADGEWEEWLSEDGRTLMQHEEWQVEVVELGEDYTEDIDAGEYADCDAALENLRYDPEEMVKAVANYRNVITQRDAQTTELSRAEFDTIARRMRQEWKERQGEDSLHETAFGEPVDLEE